MTRKLFPFALIFIILIAACTPAQPEISVEESFFNFGDVVNGQVVIKDLTVWNNGSSTLVIDAVSSSCGCTSVNMDSMDISPGESANLHIEFDSGAHGPDANGEVMRQIFIASNDPQQLEVVIEFQANVLPAE